MKTLFQKSLATIACILMFASIVTGQIQNQKYLNEAII